MQIKEPAGRRLRRAQARRKEEIRRSDAEMRRKRRIGAVGMAIAGRVAP